MKPRVKLSLRFATQAHADAALTKVTTFLDGKDVFDIPQPLRRFFDPEFGAWVVYGDVRLNRLVDRDAIRDALKDAMETAVGADRVLSGSYVSAHLSHHDEGEGGARDRASLVVRTKP